MDSCFRRDFIDVDYLIILSIFLYETIDFRL